MDQPDDQIYWRFKRLCFRYRITFGILTEGETFFAASIMTFRKSSEFDRKNPRNYFDSHELVYHVRIPVDVLKHAVGHIAVVATAAVVGAAVAGGHYHPLGAPVGGRTPATSAGKPLIIPNNIKISFQDKRSYNKKSLN